MPKKTKTPGPQGTAMPEGFTDKEEAFCQLYFLYLNRAKAAFKAGFGTSTRTARYAARDLWKREDIQNRLGEIREEWKERIGVSVERVMRERANIAFADIGKICEWTTSEMTLIHSKKLPRRLRAAIREVSHEYWLGGGRTTVKMKDNDSSLDALATFLGMKKSNVKVEHVGKDGKPLPQTTVILNIPDNGRKPKN
jgi:hypothetical protein